MGDRVEGKGRPDKCFTRLAYFAKDIGSFRSYLIANDFPRLIANLMYIPSVFPILLLNVLRMQLVSAISSFFLIAFGILIAGFVFAAGCICYKGARATYDKEKEKAPDASESESREGG